MDSANYADTISFQKRITTTFSGPKIIKMRKFEDENADLDVPDPYFGGRKGFDNVYDILYHSISNFIDYLVEKHKLQ
jgi:protein-tyrosine-phosphatase